MRKSLLSASLLVGLFILSVSAAPALAAPEWGIALEHHNAYGAQQSSCPTGKEEYFPTEPERDCGVDHFTGNGTTLDLESGFNEYKIVVKNAGTESLGAGIASVGQTTTCAPGTWSNTPTGYSYQWLRAGEPIIGATNTSYTLQAADAGKLIQCVVSATNSGGVSDAVASGQTANPATPIAVASVSATPVPSPPTAGIAAPKGTTEAGEELTCSAGAWKGIAGTEPYSYVWFRNGVKIGETPKSASTTNEYLLTTENVATAAVFQCEVIGSNGVSGDSVASISANKTTSTPAPSPTSAPPVVGGTVSRPLTSPLLSVVDQLPPGLVLAGKLQSTEVSGGGWTCTVSSDTALSCVRTEAATTLSPGSSYPAITAHVHVLNEAPEGTPPAGGVVNTATISGGGAPTASANDPTTLARVGFGIDSLTTSVTGPLETAFTQAAGHPFAASADLVFNFVPSDGGTLRTAGGSPKTITTELPPGFVGDAQAVPQCLQSQFANGAENGNSETPCPLDTAVGYLHFAYSQGRITDGRALPFTKYPWVPIYNLKPIAGTAATFGFIGGKSFAHLVLTARVRSDGDYGITIASEHTAIPPVLSVSLTFCDDGVTENPAAFPIAFGCAPITSGQHSFLTLPVRCTGAAPATTILAASYEDPSAFASMTSYTGAASPEPSFAGDLGTTGTPTSASSFTTECTHVAFSPTVTFRPPSTGTTQAGQPTSAEFSLKVPQASEQAAEPSPGHELTCNHGIWANAGSIQEEWLRDAAPITGATTDSYAVTAADEGRPLQCIIRESNGEGGIAAVSAPVPVPPEPQALPKAPPIAEPEGDATEGETLTCEPGTWSNSPSIEYQWLRNGAAIPGATSQTYVVEAADIPSELQCEMTGTNHSGSVVAISAGKETEPGPSSATPINNVLPGISVEPAPAATSSLRTATVTLPEGMTANPSAAGGLEACSNAQFGFGSTVEPATCRAASQVGTVKVITPLLEKPLEGQLFIGEPECSPCSSGDAEQGRLFRLFLQVRVPERGVIVKLAGKVSANPTTGQLQATFTEQPQLPFSELILTLKGGPRAPLANPQTCGSATTTTDLTPWSAPGLGGLSGAEAIEGTPDATPSSSFSVDWDGKGGACPTTLPFSPSFLAQTTSSAAGQYSPLSVSFGRPEPPSEAEERDEQNLAGISLNMPEGLLGKIAGVEQCAEAAANSGTCSSAAEVGTATVAAGAGSHPYYLTGHVYLTGPYKGDPFGLSIAVPAEAGPFRLTGSTGTGLEVVRAGISVNSSTAALTVTSDPLPQIVNGVPLRLHSVRVDVDRPEFTLNPTSCAAQQITASITGASVNSGEAGKTVSGSSQFAASNCAALPFSPSLSAQTQAKTSKADGASLKVVVAQKPGEVNIAKVDVQLPKQLPARLTTLQKACLAVTFQSNPAACPAASTVGMAVAHTPLLSSALTGPAILVSHGGAAFPDLEVVLQGEGVTLILDGGTDIKAGVTYSRFDTVPDAPISSFELNLPEGSDSVLATDIPASAENSLCGSNLVMPTTITAQNGKQIIQTTKITTGACTKVKTKVLTRAQKLAKALKACRTKYKAKSKKSERVKCEKQARKKYGPLHKVKKKAKKSSNRNGKAGR